MRISTLALLVAVFGCGNSSSTPDAAFDLVADVGGDLDGPKPDIIVVPDQMVPDAPVPPPPDPKGTICTSANWCWSHPKPQGFTLRSIWSDAGKLYAAGDYGTIVVYDAASKTWSGMGSGVTGTLYSVCGTTAGELYVTTYSSNYARVRRHNSSGWSEVYSAPWKYGKLNGIAAGAGKVYAAGYGSDYGRIVRLSGGAWSTVHSAPEKGATYNGIWVSPNGHVVAVGNKGILARYDGSSWTDHKTGTTNALYGVWGADESHIYVVGHNGTALRWDGSAWKPMATASSARFYGVWGRSATEIYAVGQVYKYGQGNRYVVYKSAGTSWTKVHSGLASSTSIYSSSYLYAVGGFSNELVTVGSNGLAVKHDGAAWGRISTRVTDATLYDLWAVDANTMFLVGTSGRILKRENGQWLETKLDVPFSIRGIWGTSVSNIYVVGSSGSIYRYDGTAWTSQQSDTKTSLYDVWGSSASDVFVVGANGIVLHSTDGSTWVPMASGTGGTLQAVWGSSATDVYAVGSGNTIIHFDGKEWTAAVSTATQPTYYDVWGSGSSDVYAVGYHADKTEGRVMRFDGTAWTQVYAVSKIQLKAIHGSGVDDIFVVGTSGATRHYDGKAWASQSSFAGTLEGIWTFGTEAYAVGQSGMVLHRKP